MLTSEGYVWTYECPPIIDAIYGNDSTFKDVPPVGVFGVCSDYVLEIREKMSDAR